MATGSENVDAAWAEVDQAIFYSPDTANPATCRLEKTPEGTRITVPAGNMKMYGALKIRGRNFARPARDER